MKKRVDNRGLGINCGHLVKLLAEKLQSFGVLAWAIEACGPALVG
jgi:hypothetical protein